MNFPSFDAQLPSLDRFINDLVSEYQSGSIKSWEELEVKVKAHFTPEQMDQMEILVPGWQKMASYDPNLVPFSRVMMMADNEGWTLFEPEYRLRFYKAAQAFFERVEVMIAAKPEP